MREIKLLSGQASPMTARVLAQTLWTSGCFTFFGLAQVIRNVGL